MNPEALSSWQVRAVLSRAEARAGDAGGAVRLVFLGERPSLNGWLGIALIAAGAVLIVVKR